MKRMFLVVAVLAILITNVFASQVDLGTPLSLKDNSTKPLVRDSRFTPTYSFAIEPVEIVENYYDYFPGSYSDQPMQRVQTPFLDGNWLVFHTQTDDGAQRRVYKTFIDNTGAILSNSAFGFNEIWEGFASVDLTAGGRPLLAYHANINTNTDELEVGFGYDGVIGGTAINLNSDLFSIINNPSETGFEVDGEIYDDNEFIWPSLKVGDSPIAGSQRVYIEAQNAQTHAPAESPSENVVIYFKDFTEDEIEYQTFNGEGWSSTSIPQLNEWNVSQGEFRRPQMSFIVHEDKIYYIGYHSASTSTATDAVYIDEGTLTAFVCDNYGEGEWQQYSTFGNFDAINPPFIDPYTGEVLDPYQDYFDEMPSDSLFASMGSSAHFNAAIDNQGRIHFPGFYTYNTAQRTYYPGLHTVKNFTFDTNTMNWSLSEVYPQIDNGSDPFIPNDPIDITQYETTNLYPMDSIWIPWDQDNDGLYDEVLDDGTWDGEDDGVVSTDTEYWGQPILSAIWPYMYWDTAAADDAMMFHLHTVHMTNANDHGMMAMVWQDADKSRIANLYPDDESADPAFQNMCEVVISVSADNGNHWSEPIFLNGVDTPEMAGQIPEFPYPGSEIDYIGEDENGNPIGRIHLMYLDDDTFGSYQQGIGVNSGGTMQYTAIDVVFANAPAVDIEDNNVAPSVAMLNQNYPNPFNPTTTINYNVARTGDVKLNVYNVKGQLVKTLVNDNQNVGSHSVVWNGNDNAGNTAASGVYFYKLENAGRSEMKKMVLMK